jgi:hypothetical protein
LLRLNRQVSKIKKELSSRSLRLGGSGVFMKYLRKAALFSKQSLTRLGAQPVMHEKDFSSWERRRPAGNELAFDQFLCLRQVSWQHLWLYLRLCRRPAGAPGKENPFSSDSAF